MRRVVTALGVHHVGVAVTDLPDAVDRYRRLARDVAREQGWSPAIVAVWVVVADGRTARRSLGEHRTMLRNAFPADGHAMDPWLREPDRPIAGLSFLPFGHPMRVGRGRRAAA